MRPRATIARPARNPPIDILFYEAGAAARVGINRALLPTLITNFFQAAMLQQPTIRVSSQRHHPLLQVERAPQHTQTVKRRRPLRKSQSDTAPLR